LLDAAWDRTERMLLPIPAPRSDAMRVRGVSGVPFNARCDYLARTVELNTDPVLTRPGLKHLAVHEGCPGHYVPFKLRETLFREGKAPADVLLSVVNTASSSVFEGLGDAGLAMLEWTESDDDRVQAVVNRHRAGIGTAAAWRLHALGWPEEKVEAWLRGRALLGGAGWVANRMKFIVAPARAVLIWSYWWGEPVGAAVWGGVGACGSGSASGAPPLPARAHALEREHRDVRMTARRAFRVTLAFLVGSLAQGCADRGPAAARSGRKILRVAYEREIDVLNPF